MSIGLQRVRLVKLARSYADVGMTSEPGRYMQLVAGSNGMQDSGAALSTQYAKHDDLGRMSGCALVVRGLWREIGVAHPILQNPYRIGRAVTDLVEIAAEANALREPTEGFRYLANGDVFIVGGPGMGGAEHVWMVLDTTARDYPTKGDGLLPGLDGGQRDEQGAQVIRVLQHELVDGVREPLRDGARRVRWIIDFGSVWWRFGVER